MVNRNDAAVIALCQGQFTVGWLVELGSSLIILSIDPGLTMALAWTSNWMERRLYHPCPLPIPTMDDAESTLYLPWTYHGHIYWT